MKSQTVFLGWMVAASFLRPVFAASLRDRWPSALEKGSYQAKIASTGKVLWSVEWETRVREKGKKREVEIQEKGNGTPWKSEQPITWQKTMRFSSSQPHSLQVQSVQGQRRDSRGNLLSEMEVQMDPSMGRILYRESRGGEAVKPAVLPWTPQSLPDELLFHWARTLPFEEEKTDAECLLVVSPKNQFRIRAQVRGMEQITTPAGTFSCYRVELSPRLLGPLKMLAPKMFLWCQTEPPHRWVRYQGPVGGPGSPQAILEMVQFHED